MKKHLIVTLTFIAATLAVTSNALAEPCSNQYGTGSYGSTPCTPTDLSVNKKVKTPIEPFSFVENLNENDLKYSPDTDVFFSIAVTNSGNETFEEVTVTDFLPPHIISAKVADELNGSYNSSDRKLEFKLKNLIPNETRTVEVTAHLAKTGYDTNRNVECVINKAEVSSENRTNSDTSQFCIQTNILGTTTLPSAGLEDYALLMPFLGMGILGAVLMLKKRTV